MRALFVTLISLVAATNGLEAQSAGQKIFQGKGLCYNCHGKDGRGTPLAPNLTDREWLNIDGSLPAIVALIKTGVPKPVKHPAPMPPMGGAKLSKAEIDAVAAYVKSLSSEEQAR